MRIGIIDIGSNTVRLAVYDSDTLKVIENGVNYAGLIAYVDKGAISDEGFRVLCDAILEMKRICENCLCDKICAFATASLRDISDKDRLLQNIKNQTGILIEIVSGEREAELDYRGLLSNYDVKDGAVFDLGGGSAQVITFQNGKVITHISKKIGALKLYKEFVRGVFPTQAEEERIREYVKGQLLELESKGYTCVFAMGGAASSLKKLSRAILGIECDEFSISDLKAFSEISENIINSVIPERLYTIKPALIVIDEICKSLQTEKIKVTTCGVRDGMIAELIKK